MFGTTQFNASQLLAQLVGCRVGDGQVIARMVANFKTVAVQFSNLLPRHVVALIVGEIKALRDKEGRSESILLQQRSHYRVVRFGRVIESQHD